VEVPDRRGCMRVLLAICLIGIFSSCVLSDDIQDDGLAAAATTTTCSNYKTLFLYVHDGAFDGTDTLNAGTNSNIWAMYTDGTGGKVITQHDTASVGGPALSETGQIIYYSDKKLDGTDTVLANGNMNVWTTTYAAPTAAHTNLTSYTAAGAYGRSEHIDAAGKYIAVRSTGKLDGTDATNTSAIKNIWIMNSNGSNYLPLTNYNAKGANIQSFFNSAGSEIVYRSKNTADLLDASTIQWNIWTVNVDGSSQSALMSNSTASSSQAHFFITGTKILYHSAGAFDSSDANNAGAKLNIWRMDRDGSNRAPLTNLIVAYANQGRYSIDGTKIYFISDMALDGSDASIGVENIWSMNTDGSSKTPLTSLTNASAAEMHPTASGKILFNSDMALDGSNTQNTNAAKNVWVMNTDGTGLTRLTSYTVAAINLKVWWKIGHTICAD
jgi:hypothetical protein